MCGHHFLTGSLSATVEPASAAVVELLLGDLLAGPRRIGKPLRGALSVTWSEPIS